MSQNINPSFDVMLNHPEAICITAICNENDQDNCGECGIPPCGIHERPREGATFPPNLRPRTLSQQRNEMDVESSEAQSLPTKLVNF